MPSKTKLTLGVVLVVLGSGWYLFFVSLALGVLIDETEESLLQMAAEGVGGLVIPSVGVLTAGAGYAMLHARWSNWPTVRHVVGAALGLGWVVCVGSQGIAGGQAVGGLAVALVPLIGAWYAESRARRPPDDKAALRPPGWPRRKSRWLVWVLLLPFAVFSPYLIFVEATEAGGPLLFAALVFAGTGLMFVSCLGLGLLQQSAWRREGLGARLRRLEPGGEPGLLIPSSAAARMLLLALAVALVATGVGMLGLATNLPEAAFSSRSDSAALGFTGAANLAVGVGLLSMLLRDRMYRRDGGTSGLVLTPSGVRFHWLGTGPARWDDVLAVRASTIRRHPMIELEVDPSSVRSKPAGLRAFFRPPAGLVRINPAVLLCDPIVLYHTLCFYVHNPAARTELGLPASLDRIDPHALR